MAITIAGSGITSANIADGTIVNADINSSAAIDGSKLTGLTSSQMPAGSVLQVVVGTENTVTTVATTTYTDIGLTATITPIATTSKILCMWKVTGNTGSGGTGWGSQLVRGATNIWTSNQRYEQYWTTAENRHSAANYSHLDSPNTTSATTYKVQVGSYSNHSIAFNYASSETQLILMEIAG